MVTLGGITLTAKGIVLAVVFALWLPAVIAGAVSWEKKRKKRLLRTTEIVVLAATLVLGAVWGGLVLYRPAAARVETVAARSGPRGSCALVEVGDTETKVRGRLGDPDEIRGEEELRGPRSNVWIYRDSRCAVHFFASRVESIE